MAAQVPSFEDYTHFSVKNEPLKDVQYKYIHTHTS